MALAPPVPGYPAIAEASKAAADMIAVATGLKEPEQPPITERDILLNIFMLLAERFNNEPDPDLVFDRVIEIHEGVRNLDVCSVEHAWLFVAQPVAVEVSTSAGRVIRNLAPGWNKMFYPAGSVVNGVSGQPLTIAVHRNSKESPV